MFKYDIAVIGASSTLAQAFIRAALGSGKNVLEVTSRMQSDSAENVVIWDYKTELPIAIQQASKLIIFSKFDSKRDCTQAINMLKKAIPHNVEIYNVSSLAVISRPKGRVARIIFKGDDYIRMKKFTDHSFKISFNNFYTIYPGLITADSRLGWENFLKKVQLTDSVAGINNINYKSYIIPIHTFSVELLHYIFKTKQKIHKKIIPENSDSWSSIFEGKSILRYSGNLFYDSKIKNFLFHIFTSQLIPDCMALALFKLLRKKLNNTENQVECLKSLNIDGMTRFYINADIAQR
jgi:hypothetical protein